MTTTIIRKATAKEKCDCGQPASYVKKVAGYGNMPTCQTHTGTVVGETEPTSIDRDNLMAEIAGVLRSGRKLVEANPKDTATLKVELDDLEAELETLEAMPLEEDRSTFSDDEDVTRT